MRHVASEVEAFFRDEGVEAPAAETVKRVEEACEALRAARGVVLPSLVRTMLLTFDDALVYGDMIVTAERLSDPCEEGVVVGFDARGGAELLIVGDGDDPPVFTLYPRSDYRPKTEKFVTMPSVSAWIKVATWNAKARAQSSREWSVGFDLDHDRRERLVLALTTLLGAVAWEDEGRALVWRNSEGFARLRYWERDRCGLHLLGDKPQWEETMWDVLVAAGARKKFGDLARKKSGQWFRAEMDLDETVKLRRLRDYDGGQ